MFFTVYDAQVVIDGNKYNKHIYIFMNIKRLSLLCFLNRILPNSEKVIYLRIAVGTMHRECEKIMVSDLQTLMKHLFIYFPHK
jgi:hypothetical protein